MTEIPSSFYHKNLVVENTEETKNLRKELDGSDYIS